MSPVHGPAMASSRTSLVEDLRRLGVEAGAIVMVHASLRAIGPVHGGPDQVHCAVEEAVTPSGTVAMYVGCESGFDDIGRGVLSAEQEADLLVHQPPFDFASSRAARAFGALAELFRSYPGTVCSRSVCARVAARGGRATWLTQDHPWNYGFGHGSPFAKLCEAGGKVLLLGSDLDEVTVLHHAEHIAPFAGKRVARYKVPLSRDGRTEWVDCEEFDTGGDGVNAGWPPRPFARIVEDFMSRSAGTPRCRRGRVGRAHSVLLDAASLVAHAVPIMCGWANDPAG